MQSMNEQESQAVRQAGAVAFREEQRFRQWWVWLLVYGAAALGWYGFIQQIIFGQPWGTNPAPDWAMWLIWLFIHLINLVEYRSRVLVLIQWGWNYFIRNRSARLIAYDTGPHDGHVRDMPPADVSDQEPQAVLGIGELPNRSHAERRRTA